MLQEYFFEDWRKIQQVFKDEEQPPELQIIQNVEPTDAEAAVGERHKRFRVNPTISPAAIEKIYSS